MPKRAPNRLKPEPSKAAPAKKKSTPRKKRLPADSWVRRQAAIDYITDPESRSVQFHYNRKDREYSSLTGFDSFSAWSKADSWGPRREQFWADMERRVFQAHQDHMLKLRMEELQVLMELRHEAMQFIKPVTDDDGNVVIDPDTRFPRYRVEPGKYHQMVEAYLKLDERISVRRGEATQRAETITREEGENAGSKALSAVDDPVGRKLNYSKEEIKAMARAVIREKQKRQLALEQGEPIEDDDA